MKILSSPSICSVLRNEVDFNLCAREVAVVGHEQRLEGEVAVQERASVVRLRDVVDVEHHLVVALYNNTF